ncbi:MAG: hypothetical protein NUV65_05680 [Candidatus Roizmanbacteria bacterium]|nr:hypothetical protein [Candidatus Roizmanbacteria bacterium]
MAENNGGNRDFQVNDHKDLRVDDLQNVSAQIQTAIDNTDPATIAYWRNKLIKGARDGVFSPKAAIDAAFPPYFGDVSKQVGT